MLETFKQVNVNSLNLVLKIIRLSLTSSFTYLGINLSDVVDPDVAISPKLKEFNDVIEVCLVASLSLNSTLVHTSDEFAF